MNNSNYARTGIFFGIIFLLVNDMTSKFIAGFLTGIFVSTKYDFKPYVSLIEDKIISLQKELESKREEIHQKDIEKQVPRVSDHNWGFYWPWSEQESSSNTGPKKN
jgi:hypothetical protein